VEFVRTIVAAYLIATLATAALAKLKSWPASAVSVMRETVIPPRAAATAVLVTAATELLLATLFMLGTGSAAAGFTAVGLFLGFCVYQLLVAAKTNALTCSCAGTSRTDAASVPAVAGTVLACLIQAGLACVFAITNANSSRIFHIVAFTAWVIPLVVFLVSFFRRIGGRTAIG